VWQPPLRPIDNSEIILPQGATTEEKLYGLFSSIYNIEKDDEGIRSLNKFKDEKRKVLFDKLRKEYPIRREFSNYSVKISSEELVFKPILEAFRFKVIT
jgi:erythronate-4-phosphate dehydrogenase